MSAAVLRLSMTDTEDPLQDSDYSETTFFLPEISIPSNTQPPSPDSPSSPESEGGKSAGSKSLNDADPVPIPRRQHWKTSALSLSPWTINDSYLNTSVDPPRSPSTSSWDVHTDERKREALRPMLPQQREESPPFAFATPFIPGISGGIWSPQWAPAVPERKVDDKDAKIIALQERVQRLSIEKDMALNDNSRLLGEVQQLSALLADRAFPPAAALAVAPPRAYSVPPPPPVPVPPSLGDSLYQSLGLNLHDSYRPPTAPQQHPVPPPPVFVPTATVDAVTGTYRPSTMTVDLILSGKLDYMRMDPRSEYDLIRPLVWIIAHQEPKSNAQAATLKIAANALGLRLGQPRSYPITQYLVSVITEWAKPLCFTSNGNYLCQQLLEKCAVEDKINFIKMIENDIVSIANNKFGAHVLVKAVGVKELEGRISDALVSYGIYESMQTGARKVWRPYLGKCRSAGEQGIFDQILSEMSGRWADLAVSNENGSISVQQIFEGCANQNLIDACFNEILDDISRVANNQFGHFVVNKLLNFHEPMIKAVSHSILTAYPPLATNHHGVQFVEFVIGSNRIQQRAHIVKYLDSLCSQKDGRTPAIVTVANSSVGRGHLQTLLRQVPAGERVLMSRVHSTCRQFQTTLRNSQSGNELLRSLGIINTPARRL